MKVFKNKVNMFRLFIVVSAILVIPQLAPEPAFAHGGKTHNEAFTALQAVQKATELYDRLILSGKLAEPWETKLKNIQISTRYNGKQKEYVVRFETDQPEPSSVYFFFDREGAYAGSNYSGK